MYLPIKNIMLTFDLRSNQINDANYKGHKQEKGETNGCEFRVISLHRIELLRSDLSHLFNSNKLILRNKDTAKKTKISYKDKLKDPRWQKKRLEIFERDSFECQCCLSDEKTLVVHHKKYTADPCDEPNKNLITLCERCHDMFHDKHLRYSDSDYYLPYRLYGMTTTDIFLLEMRIYGLIFKYKSDASRRIIDSLKRADFI